METDDSLTARLVAQVAPELADHAAVLAEFASRLPHDELTGARDLLEGSGADQAWALANWGRRIAAEGADYAGALIQLADLRRALLPSILQCYPAGPELQLLFAALDAWEQAARTLLAAAFIEAVQVHLKQTTRLRSLARMTGGLLHALNNSLANILGRAQLLEEEEAGNDPPTAREAHEIASAARAAAENLARVQSYAAPAEQEAAHAFDLNAVVAESIKLTRHRWRDDAEANGIVIDVVEDLADVPPVWGQRDRVRAALVELILNAAEALPRGGSVAVRTERVGSEVRLTVSDLGEGMEEATRAHALEPFFTTRGGDHVGLGLTLVGEAVAEQGGRIEIESAPARGTSITLSLPLSPVPLEAAIPPVPAQGRALRLLVVDDDAAVRKVAARSLERRGNQVVAAESGAEALEIFRERGPFDAMLCDLGMAGMNGFELARAVKDQDPRVVVVLMTGWGPRLDPRQIRASGIDGVVNKPFDVEQALQLMNDALAKREQKE